MSCLVKRTNLQTGNVEFSESDRVWTSDRRRAFDFGSSRHLAEQVKKMCEAESESYYFVTLEETADAT